jgi:hypothetical protein
MNANELRIGNLIQKNDEICEVSSIHSDSTIRIFNNDKTDTFGCFVLRIFNPIPLTEEWLFKFGFEKDEENEYWFWKNCVSVSVLGYIELLSFNRQSFKTNIQLKYIHQLQNFYFALTGKELVVPDAVLSCPKIR